MKFTFTKYLLLVLLVAFVVSCGKDDDDDPIDETPVGTVYNKISFSPGAAEDDILAAFIQMETGDTISFEAGNYPFTKSLSLLDIDSVVIAGAGQEATILDFSNQIEGAEGILATNCKMLMFAHLTVRNTVGDAIKGKDCDGLTFYKVTAEWTGEVSSNNGAYGLYPVQSANVLLDGCIARGASDAGLYVGQCNGAIVKNCIAYENVAGIEVENTMNAEVFDNLAYDNTGGILIFDLPNLAVSGNHCRVFNNEIRDNSHQNFAKSGVVGQVPPGTGIMILSTKTVEVFNNTITNNNIMGIGIINYQVLAVFDEDLATDDENFDSYPDNIYIHDNTISRTENYPPGLNDVGNVLQLQFPSGDMPDIIFDGFTREGQQICIQNNGDASFVDIDADNSFLNKNFDTAPYDCSITPLSESTVNAPIWK